MIDDAKKEEVKLAADIVEVVGDHVKLKRSGSGFMGLCPFHNEKTPSFHVTPRLGIYKCFGCGEAGDVINFVMQMEGVGFSEAVRSLAQRYGVFVPEEEEKVDDPNMHLKEGVYHALRYAGVFFHRILIEHPEAEEARQYLKKRGFTAETIKKYGLGFSLDRFDALIATALDSGLNEQYLHEAGLVKPSQKGGSAYDTFRGRVMFPIFSPTSKVIAFGGRVLGKDKTAKYINSPQTLVYNKSEALYGIQVAKNEIRKKDEVILVEGYTDVLSLHQAGVKNVVSTSGTAITPDQVRIMRRYSENLLMIYDSDSAGQNAMLRGIDIGLAEGMNIRSLALPEGEDPDSFVRQFGGESFGEYRRDNSKDFLSFMVKNAESQGQWDDPINKKQSISRIISSIANIPDGVSRETFVQFLNEKSRVGDQALFAELGQVLAENERKRKRDKRREEMIKEREARQKAETTTRPGTPSPSSAPATDGPPPPTGDDGWMDAVPPYENPPPDLDEFGSPGMDMPPDLHVEPANDAFAAASSIRDKRFDAEKDLIRLMLEFGLKMVEFIGSHIHEQHFENNLLRQFFNDMVGRFNNEEDISTEYYSGREHPFPALVGEIVMEMHTPSERGLEKHGTLLVRDRDPVKTAKTSLKTVMKDYLLRLEDDYRFKMAETQDDEGRIEIMRLISEIGKERRRVANTSADQLFESPPGFEAEDESDTSDGSEFNPNRYLRRSDS